MSYYASSTILGADGTILSKFVQTLVPWSLLPKE